MTPPDSLSDQAEQLIPLLNSLSATDRLGLAQYLERSVEPEHESDMDEEIRAAWEKEIMRRIAEVESGEEKGIPAEEVHRLGGELIVRTRQYHRLAWRELQSEARYYSRKQSGLGLEFLHQIDQAEQKASLDPAALSGFRGIRQTGRM